MLVDINLSEELMKVFHNEFLKSESKLNINFSVNVLKTTIWPLTLLSVSSSFCIPKQLLPCVENVNILNIYISIFYELQLFMILFICASLICSTIKNQKQKS